MSVFELVNLLASSLTNSIKFFSDHLSSLPPITDALEMFAWGFRFSVRLASWEVFVTFVLKQNNIPNGIWFKAHDLFSTVTGNRQICPGSE